MAGATVTISGGMGDHGRRDGEKTRRDRDDIGRIIMMSNRNHYDIRPRHDDNDIPEPKSNLNVAR